MRQIVCCGRRQRMWWGEAVVLTPIVKTKAGPIRGRHFSVDDRDYGMYMGIPFAEPPVDELRFKKPVPHEPWDEPLDCIEFGPRCPQQDSLVQYFFNIKGVSEEKCLTLNVFAPENKSDDWPSGYPVMVWIHGGGFSMHSASNYGDVSICRNLCSKDVIVVTIQYRLGAFGFLVTGEECKGNFGLWDQTLALQWVQDNIQSFGGDPSNVTVFGQSAGASSTDLLALSPHSRNLFNKAICMSGSSECSWSIRSSEWQIELTKLLARELGWMEHEGEDLLSFLKDQPASTLQRCIRSKVAFPGQLIFSPNMDVDFFPRSLEELRNEMPKKVYMMGSTLYEGLFFHAVWSLKPTLEDMRRVMRDACGTVQGHSNDEEFCDKVMDYYMEGADRNDKRMILEKFVDLCSDISVNNGVSRAARKLFNSGHKVFMYSYDYCNHNNFGLLKFIMPFTGATHCSEIRYVLGKGIFCKFRPDETDLKMLEFTARLWTDFAKYGDPNGHSDSPALDPVWEEYVPDRMNFYRIDEKPGPSVDFACRREEFWSQFMDKPFIDA